MKNSPLTFGPIHSRRFGISLGIDLSPNTKQCNFDCLYCELEKAKTMEKQKESISVEEYIDAVQKELNNHKKIDVITITANGEPTMYPYLDQLIDRLNSIKGSTKLMILSNSATINQKETYEPLLKLDIVKLSLDCASEKCFKKLDRLDESIGYQNIIDGIINFSKIYTKDLIIEILFVDTLNNKDDEIKALYKILQEINPTRVDIGTIDRPPAYDVKAVSYKELQDIASKFEGINVAIAHRKKIALHDSYDNQSILNMLSKRPLSDDDIENLFDDESKVRFQELLQSNKIIKKDQGGVVFYATR